MKNLIAQHRAALILAMQRLLRVPLNTFLAALAIGIALALPAGGLMLVSGLQRVAQGGSSTPQISVFMELEASKAEVAAAEARLRGNPDVGAVQFVAREATLQRMKTREGLGEVIDALPKNPFPDAFIISPRDDTPEAMERLRDEFAKLPKVGHVQLDSAWVKRLAALLRLARTAMWLLGCLFGLGLMAITFNAIRMQILTHREEIEVVRLLGASDGYIRRPFYYFGTMQGLLGGIVALLIVVVGVFLLRQPVAELAVLYDLKLALDLPGALPSLALIGVAIGLGWLGAALSVGRYIRG